MEKIISLFFALFGLLCLPSFLHAQGKQSPGMPPAVVVVSEVGTGLIAPKTEFIGTVYYQEVSDVASEVAGKVEKVNIEEGQRVKKGDILVMISSDLLEKTIQATRANYEQVLTDLEKERKNLERAESLFREELLSEQSYDERRFAVAGLEKKAVSLKAEVERLEVELNKKAVVSPFNGIVVKKSAERGEWLSAGSVVATVGRDDSVDIVAEIPQEIVRYVKTGTSAIVRSGRTEMGGKVLAIVPRGDISTRTIPVKVRVQNKTSLIEGMEAHVVLPSGEKQKTFTVPRDGVITVFGNTVIFVVVDSQAKMIPVKVAGYEGMNAGVVAEGLAEGMKVIIKGNERLRDGQPVNVQHQKISE